MKVYFFFVMTLVFSTTANAQIYKWVDENGVTHFGQQPPAQKETKKIKERIGNSFQSHRDTESSESQDRTSSTSSSEKTEEKSQHVDCYGAVDNTKSSFKTLREVGREKYRSGEITKEDYEKGIKNLEKANHAATRRDCEKSTGDKRKFYQCMDEGDGSVTHIILCAGFHQFN